MPRPGRGKDNPAAAGIKDDLDCYIKELRIKIRNSFTTVLPLLKTGFDLRVTWVDLRASILNSTTVKHLLLGQGYFVRR